MSNYDEYKTLTVPCNACHCLVDEEDKRWELVQAAWNDKLQAWELLLGHRKPQGPGAY